MTHLKNYNSATKFKKTNQVKHEMVASRVYKKKKNDFKDVTIEQSNWIPNLEREKVTKIG